MSISISKSLAKKKILVEYLRQTYGLNVSKIIMSSRINGLNPYCRVIDVPDHILSKLDRFLNTNFVTGRVLRQSVNKNVRRLVETGSYRGLRISQGLPAHGQRTHTNAKTAKTAKKTVAVAKLDTANTAKYAKHIKTSAYGSKKLNRSSKSFLGKQKKNTTSKKKKK
jgi:small subunit ribosomal protein S13